MRPAQAAGRWLPVAATQVAVYATYALFILLPLAYSASTYDLFALPKVVVLRLLTLLALVSLAAIAHANRRVVIGRTALDLPLLAFAVVLAAATATSVAPDISLNGEYLRYDGLYTNLSYFVLFLLAAHVLKRRRVVRAMTLIGLTSVVVALEALAERLGYGALLPGARFFEGRMSSFLGNPDFLGTYLVLTIPATLGLLLHSRDRWGRTGWAAATAIGAVALALSYTRGAWIGFAVGLLVFAIEWRQLRQNAAWLAGVAVAVVLSIAVVEQLPPPLPAGGSAESAGGAEATAARADESVADRLRTVGDVGVGTASVRLQIWQSALPLVLENPVLGTGPNTFQSVFAKHAVPEYAAGEGRDRDPDRAHNGYLHLAVTSGLLGLASYLAILGAFALMMHRWLRRENRPRARAVGVAILAAWVGYLVQDFFLFGVVETAAYWWLLMGLGAALAYEEGRPRLVLRLPAPAALRWLAGAAVVALALYFGAGAIRMWQADYAFMQGRMAFHDPRVVNNPEVPLQRYREALALAPQQQFYYEVYASALATLGERENKDAARRRGYLDQAIQVMNAAISRNPEFSALYQRRGAIYDLYGDDHRLDALADYQRAVALYPYGYHANRQLGEAAALLGKWPEAIGAQRTILTLDPADRTAGVNLSVAYVSIGRLAEAAAVLQGLIDRNPDDLEVRTRLALVLERQGEYGRARAEYQAVLDAEPQNEAAKAGLGRLDSGTPLPPRPGGPRPMGH